MRTNPCVDCKKLIDNETNKRHINLKRTGLATSVGFHGSTDDEYYYVCDVCNSRFIGDSCGTWPDKQK